MHQVFGRPGLLVVGAVRAGSVNPEGGLFECWGHLAVGRPGSKLALRIVALVKYAALRQAIG